MEKVIESKPLITTVEKTLNELYQFLSAADGWVRSNQNNVNTDLGKAYMEIYPGIQMALLPMNELKIRHEKLVRDCRTAHADSVKESEFTDKPNSIVTEFTYNTVPIVKWSFFGIKKIIGKKNNYTALKEALTKIGMEIEKERQALLNKKVLVNTFYAKTVPNHQILDTNSLQIFKGMIVHPDYDKGGIIRDVKR